jgi:hypothetical protein
LGALAQSHPPRPGGGPLHQPPDPDGGIPDPGPAELTATVLTGDGETTIVVRSPGDVEVVTWPVAGGGACDLALVDALARLQLAARRWGCAIRLRGAEDDLLGLVDLIGLKEVLTGPSGSEVAGEAEGLEEGEIEEVVLADDPAT